MFHFLHFEMVTRTFGHVAIMTPHTLGGSEFQWKMTETFESSRIGTSEKEL